MAHSSRSERFCRKLTIAGWVGAMVLAALLSESPAHAGTIIVRPGGVTLQQSGSGSSYPYPDWRTRSRIDRRHVEDSTLIHPVIINSEIEDSTLVNPVIITPSHTYSRPRRSTTSQPRNPTCITPYSSLRMACQ